MKTSNFNKILKEGLSFSDYFSDEIPPEVKPTFPTTPTCEEMDVPPLRNYGEDYPLRAKNLYKGLWETEELKNNKFSSLWLDRTGNFYSARDSHLNFAKKYLDKNKIKFGEWKQSEKMYSLGFIRVSLYHISNEVYFEYDKRIGPPNTRQMSSMMNVAKERGYQLKDGIKDVYIELTESLLFKNIIKESARILPRNSLYWLTPEGKFENIGISPSHLNWAKEHHKEIGLSNTNFSNLEPVFLKGYIRIVIDEKENIMFVEYSKIKPPTNLQRKTLIDSSIMSNFSLYDTVMGKVVRERTPIGENLNESKNKRKLFIESMKPDNLDTFKSHLAQLFAYLQKELQLKTVPKVKLVSDDKNASKVLGKTAYYDPDTKTICLYITDRHMKDVLRSFSHECVHHFQHENEQLSQPASSTKNDPEYAQNNKWLREMEKMAYLRGSLLFRDWEDNKKAEDRKSSKNSDKI